MTKEQVTLDFGFEAEYVGGYKTISGNEQRDIDEATGYYLSDLEIGNVVTGYPEVIIFDNNEKDDDDEYIKNYQSPRVRVIDHDEYVDCYANIPRRDEEGIIRNIYKSNDFYKSGFNLVFGFMRWVDETNVIDSTGEEIDHIKAVNIETVCKMIDSMEYIKIKVVEGASEEYPSFIILDLKEKI